MSLILIAGVSQRAWSTHGSPLAESGLLFLILYRHACTVLCIHYISRRISNFNTLEKGLVRFSELPLGADKLILKPFCSHLQMSGICSSNRLVLMKHSILRKSPKDISHLDAESCLDLEDEHAALSPALTCRAQNISRYQSNFCVKGGLRSC